MQRITVQHAILLVLPAILLAALTICCAPQVSSSQPAAARTATSSEPDTTLQPALPTSGVQTLTHPTNIPGAKGVRNQGGNPSQNSRLEVPSQPYNVILGRPTNTSITLSLLSATGQTLNVAYGPEKGARQEISASLAASIPSEIVLTDLAPDTRYTYSINGSQPLSFHTARPPGAAFTFTIQADSHLDTNTDLHLYGQTLANQRADQPDFTIDLGDTFMTEKYNPYTEAKEQYLLQRYYLGQIGQTAPIFLVLGNHDGEGAPKGSAGQEMSVWSAQMRTKYFPNPIPDAFYTGNSTPEPTAGFLQDYYAWTWGDALFVVLDPYWFTPPAKGGDNNLWNPTLGVDQYQWLKTVLQITQAKYKFVFIHQLLSGTDKNGRGGVEVAPFYEWGGHNPDGSYAFDQYRPGWGLPIHELLVASGVNAVFHGHDHLFAKQELDGIVYQEVPQPGLVVKKNASLDEGSIYLNGDKLSSSGHLRVNVTPERVVVEYVRSYLPGEEGPGRHNGQVDYRYEILPAW